VRRLLSAELDVRATTQGLLEIPFMLAGNRAGRDTARNIWPRHREARAREELMPLPFETPDTREVVIWHKRNEPDPAHAWLREVFDRRRSVTLSGQSGSWSDGAGDPP